MGFGYHIKDEPDGANDVELNNRPPRCPFIAESLKRCISDYQDRPESGTYLWGAGQLKVWWKCEVEVKSFFFITLG